MLAFAKLPFASSGSFLITPNVGIMIWTLVVFAISVVVLRRYVYPLIAQALDKRANDITEEIDAASKLRDEADTVLEEYRERLKEARGQAEEIVTRARKAGEAHEKEAQEQAQTRREQMLEQTRRDIETETRRAIDEIRREVADLTLIATERVTRKVLDQDDQRRLVEEALSELDFSSLSGGGGDH
jgi:F-type H+-transporting ATPase subunit b